MVKKKGVNLEVYSCYKGLLEVWKGEKEGYFLGEVGFRFFLVIRKIGLFILLLFCNFFLRFGFLDLV